MKILTVTISIAIIIFVTTPCLAAGNSASGKDVSQQCVSCHGENGNSPTPNFPRLAGQHEDYLYFALQSYKNGKRKNPIMAGIVGGLSDDDMRNVSAYFASQSGLSIINAETESKDLLNYSFF